MPNRKKKRRTTFHKDFKLPTSQQRKDALGSFPCQSQAKISREEMLRKSARRGQPSLERREKGENGEIQLAISDIDEERLFIPTSRSQTSFATPKPQFELDWLAQVAEEGQSYDDYLRFLTTRKTGRIRPHANVDGIDIVLLPIIRSDEYPKMQGREQSNQPWPDYGPSLDKLVQYTRVFFDRQVRVLPAAQLYASDRLPVDGRARKKQKVASSQPGSFASKRKFQLFLPQSDGSLSHPVEIAGRDDFKSERIQLKVDSLLEELSRYRYSTHDPLKDEKDFCIMGITMEDLYDSPSDLFCAGMAFGGDKVAVFSFKRYHPLIKMHPQHWHHYGYGQTFDGYSYYSNANQDPKGMLPHPPMISNCNSEAESEFLRRSGKLLTHELGHLYGLDHCIHNRCLMMGTGHLVEDFRAPSHLCGVCLRKLQWRTGFDVKVRYRILAEAYSDMGLEDEQKWALKQHNHLIK